MKIDLQRYWWYWLTIGVAIFSELAILIIPEGIYPLSFIREFFGLVFVMFLPGFALIKNLYPSKVPTKSSLETLNSLERLALSIGMSLIITPTLGLLLNYTEWGIRLVPVSLSLFSFTVIVASIALLRDFYAE